MVSSSSPRRGSVPGSRGASLPGSPKAPPRKESTNGTSSQQQPPAPGAAASSRNPSPKPSPKQHPKKTGKKEAAPDSSQKTAYKRLSHHEHILKRPDTYIGTLQQRFEKAMFLLNDDRSKFVEKPLSYIPGLYKIFDEILVNAADHLQRDAKCDEIRVDFLLEDGGIAVYNNGDGIPVSWHAKEKMYVPQLIFGNLLAGENFDDTQKRVVGGKNGYGAKLANIFSTKFVLETVDAKVVHGKGMAMSRRGVLVLGVVVMVARVRRFVVIEWGRWIIPRYGDWGQYATGDNVTGYVHRLVG